MAGDRLPPEGVALCARYRALDGPGMLGGDFYARCENENGTRVIIGDVRGKGAPAARKARLLASAFLLIARAGSNLEDVSLALDQLASADAAAEWDLVAREWFATAVLLEIDRQGRSVKVINHGHPAPVLVGPDRVRELAPSRVRLPLGLGELVTVDGFADTVELPADATLLLFTDGVSEARDRAGRMFDPVAWLAAANGAGFGPSGAAGEAAPAGDGEQAPAGTSAGMPADPSRLLDSLLVEVERHNGGDWHDDLALVSVRRSAVQAAAPAPQPPSGPPPGRTPPVTLPPAMVPPSQATRRPVAPRRPRAPRNPSRRPGDPPPCADGGQAP